MSRYAAKFGRSRAVLASREAHHSAALSQRALPMRSLASHGAKGAANAKGRNYKRERVIGRGSFGTAYLVRCRTDSRHYVLKRLDLGHMNKKEQDEAMNEARVLEKLRRHPNIIRVREHFVEEGRLCIVMDFADGGDLAQRIEAQKDSAANDEAPEPFSEDMVLDWFVQICLALKHAHDRKVRHRDLTPQNCTCLLLTTHYSLLTAHCSLLTAHCSLLTTNY